jgi:hypothetical protein
MEEIKKVFERLANAAENADTFSWRLVLFQLARLNRESLLIACFEIGFENET